MSMNDDIDRARRTLTNWALARVFLPIAVFLATIWLGNALDAWPDSWISPVTSVSTAIFAFGLLVFPGATFFALTSQLMALRVQAARIWPMVKGRVVTSGEEGFGSSVFLRIRFRYTVNGKEYENATPHLGNIWGVGNATAWQVLAVHPAGTEVEVRYDPADPEGGIVPELAQLGARRGMQLAAAFFLLPFVLSFLFVWLNSR
jgi:hypothetical protein